MKKILLLALLVITVLSCGTPKTVIQSKKVIKGYWNLNQITYSEVGEYKVTLFDAASKECFEGSAWRFIPNNNTGVYTINNSGCPAGENHFIFTIQEIDQATGMYDFLLKPTNEKNKSESNSGVRLQLTKLTDTSMQWQQTLQVDGKPFTISMNFLKEILD